MKLKKEPCQAQLDEETALLEQEAAYEIEHSLIAELPQGFVINNPNNNETYAVLEKLPGGGEGHTYLVQEQAGQKKVVKLVSAGISTTTSELEQKLREEYRKVNGVIGTKMTAFAANLLDVAVVNDYVEGRNLRQEMEEVDCVFNETQTVDFLLQITKNYLRPLHENELVHRDIKPQNIISTTADEKRTYTLIDFGLLRKVSPNATITTTLSGTPGYSRIKADYECADDYYSLAKTAYYLFAGKDPEYVGHAKYDALHDEEIFGALKINDNLRKVLFRMLGHEQKNKYQSCDDLIADLEKLQSKVGKNKAVGKEEIGVDLKSAQILTEQREARQLPLSLQRKINGLKQRFKEQYEGTLASRVDLEKDFVSDLEETLYSLGYQKGTTSGELTGMNFYYREQRDSKNVDALLVNPTNKGEHHLKYCKVKAPEEAGKLFTHQYQNNEAYYTIPKRIAMWASTLGAITYGAVLGSHWNGGAAFGLGVVGLLTAYIAAQVNYKYPLQGGIEDEFSSETKHRMDASNSTWWGLLGFPLPHSVGKISYRAGNFFAKRSQENKITKNAAALNNALQPAPHFTYKRIEV